MTTIEHTDTLDHATPTHGEPDDVHVHKPNSFYIKVAVALGVRHRQSRSALYYLDIGKLFLPVLLVLMVDQVRHRGLAVHAPAGSTTSSSAGCSTPDCSWRCSCTSPRC